MGEICIFGIVVTEDKSPSALMRLVIKKLTIYEQVFETPDEIECTYDDIDDDSEVTFELYDDVETSLKYNGYNGKKFKRIFNNKNYGIIRKIDGFFFDTFTSHMVIYIADHDSPVTSVDDLDKLSSLFKKLQKQNRLQPDNYIGLSLH
jgi:hypothetical protein